MKQKHILNIGMPKCGTTWLWAQLYQHPDVRLIGLQKEPPYFLENINFDSYKKLYKNFDVSANFHVSTWQIDQCLIQQLDSVATHTTILVSDPYLFIERFYNWLPKELDRSEFVDMCINSKHICYSEIVNRWTKNLANSKFKILIYDDLVNDSLQFLSDYFNFCGLRDVVLPDYKRIINANLQPKISVPFSTQQIKAINAEVEKFEKLTGRNFSHWLR